MSAPDSGIHLGFDVVELDEGDFEAILSEGGDDNGFYTLKSKPPVACRWVCEYATRLSGTGGEGSCQQRQEALLSGLSG